MKRMYLGWGLVIWVGVLLVWQAGRYMATSQQEAVAHVTQKVQRSQGRAAAESCVACHALSSPKHMVGPHLVDIIGRPAGSLDDFNYSPAMKRSGIVWTREKLRAFLLKPMEVVPDTAMGITGIPESEVDELLDFLEHEQ